jgi:hypothetical protein
MPLLRTKSTTPELRGASLHVFSFTTEALFRKGKPEIQALVDSLLQTSIESRYQPNVRCKSSTISKRRMLTGSKTSQCFIFIGHGLACWVVQHALAFYNPTTTSAKIDSICGVILWDPPERQKDAEWDAFVAPYIKTARKDSVLLRAQFIRTIEKNFEELERHPDFVVPEVRRIEGSSITGSEVRAHLQSIT